MEAPFFIAVKKNDVDAAISTLSDARGTPVPETEEQRRWIDNYAATLAGTN